MAEAGGGRYCFNWNLGNVKAAEDEQHMYLRNVWECESQSKADKNVALAHGLARIATAVEIRKHGWSCRTSSSTSRRISMARFRAYDSLVGGAQRRLAHHRSIAHGNSDYVRALNAADITAVAHALKQAGYYTAGEADYARAMTRTKKEVDQALGPLK